MKVINIHPCGFFLKVKLVPYEATSEGGIITCAPTEQAREQRGRDVGKVLEVGPIAYRGFSTCKDSKDWGCKVGDYVEFNRYDGKETRAAEMNEELTDIRIILDKDVMAVWEVEE